MIPPIRVGGISRVRFLQLPYANVKLCQGDTRIQHLTLFPIPAPEVHATHQYLHQYTPT